MTPNAMEQFFERFPMDDRAATYLQQCPVEVQEKVLATFDPRSQASDYSRQVTAYINSLMHSFEAAPPKRSREEHPHRRSDKRARAYSPAWEPQVMAPEGPLHDFRVRYPMDKRAWDYLCASSAAVQAKVIAGFRPRTEGEDDYSSLITSWVKKLRAVIPDDPIETQEEPFAYPDIPGPSLQMLRDFRNRYPMDRRAWEFLTAASGVVQEAVLCEFRPRREGEADYSAVITSFVRSSETRAERSGQLPSRSVSRCQLEMFRERFPMDTRAWDFLATSLPEIQEEVVRNFNPRSLEEADFSRQVTGFVRQLQRNGVSRVERLGYAAKLEEEEHRGGWSRGRGGEHGSRGDEGGRVSRGWQGARRDAILQDFRARYPMDDRAFDFLEQAPSEVQNAVLADFNPRESSDGDYSALVTSFTRRMLRRQVPAHNDAHQEGAEWDAFEDFRRRYPVDERAWEFLISSPPSVQTEVLETFRPKREGEADYSRLVTTFVKRCRLAQS